MKNLPLLQEFIQLSLKESTRADREKVGLRSEWDEIEKYVDKNCFIHLGEINKLGVNPHSQYYETPLGIYGYPLTQQIYEQLISNKLPNFNQEQYIHIFRARNPGKVLVLQDMDEEDCLNYINQFCKLHQMELYSSYEEITKSFHYFHNDTFPGKLFYRSLRALESLINRPHRWAHSFPKIGIDGIIDMGSGIIYQEEPTQAIFFSRNAIEQLDTFSNPQFRNKRKIKIVNSRNELKSALNKDQLRIIYNLYKGDKTQTEIADELEKNKLEDKLNHEMIFDVLNSDSFPEFVNKVLGNQKVAKEILKEPIF